MIKTILHRLLAIPDRITRNAVPPPARPVHDLTFTQLNHGWNAYPNGAKLETELDGSTLVARFPPNPYQFEAYADVDLITLRFEDCARYRVTQLNDHGFALGQCRFSRIAPAWGAFYEIAGDTRDAHDPTQWEPAPGSGTRHFHFYQRDHTLEVKAARWRKDI